MSAVMFLLRSSGTVEGRKKLIRKLYMYSGCVALLGIHVGATSKQSEYIYMKSYFHPCLYPGWQY